MISPQPVLVGVFARASHANAAVEALVGANFQKERLSVVCPTNCRETFEGVEKVAPAGENTIDLTMAGGAIGSILGGATAAAGIVATGGTGLLIAGPFLGAAAAGGMAGGFLGAMSSRGIEPEIADFYDQALQRGEVLVAVEPGDGPSLVDARRLLVEHGADAKRLPDAS